jgi:hypothetical protein
LKAIETQVAEGTVCSKRIENLFWAMDEIVAPDLHPSSVVRILARIGGTAFFPGGCGLFLEGRELDKVHFPSGGVMVLGHNLDSEAGFRQSLLRGKEKLNGGTWRSLVSILKSAAVPLEQCFFTNAFMGLCSGNDSFRYRGRDDERFRAACLAFLKVQIGFQRPSLIVTLGLHVPPMLAELSSDLSCWKERTLHLSDLDANPLIVAAEFGLDDSRVHTSVVVPIAHPSMPNNGKRSPRWFPPGKKGEIELLRTGWTIARRNRLS